jgi:O-antigen ligase
LRKLKKYALLVFIISLVPGDTFYKDLGITQGIFLLPMLLVYIINGNILPSIGKLKQAGIIMMAIISIQLLFSNFQGIIQWYRTMGGIILSFMIVVLYSNYKDVDKQIMWLMLAALFPVIGFYLGFWQNIGEDNLRKTFLKHDPNILAHLLVYGVIAALYSLRDNNSKWLKIKYLIPLIILFFFPIAFTFSRTALFGFIIICFLYTFHVMNLKYKIGVFTMLLILSLSATSMFTIENEIITGFYGRFEEGNDKRENYLNSSIEVIRNNFFTGVGVGTFENSSWRIANGFTRSEIDYHTGDIDDVSTASHNGLLDIFMIGGIGLFIAFLIIVLYPAYFFTFSKFEKNKSLQYHKFIVYSLAVSFILINLTYSLYNSKLGWYGIGFSYLVIYPYYFRKTGFKPLSPN